MPAIPSPVTAVSTIVGMAPSYRYDEDADEDTANRFG